MKIQELTKKVHDKLESEGVGWINLGQVMATLVATEECGFIQKTLVDPDSVVLPRELTAENGAKYLMSGEFKEETTMPCWPCNEDGHEDTCELCGGHGEYTEKVTISWTTIKEIYKKVVGHYAS